MRKFIPILILAMLIFSAIVDMSMAVKWQRVNKYTFDELTGEEGDNIEWSYAKPNGTMVGYDRDRKIALPDDYYAIALKRESHWNPVYTHPTLSVQFTKIIPHPGGTWAYVLTTGKTIWTYNFTTETATQMTDLLSAPLYDVSFGPGGSYAIGVGKQEYILHIGNPVGARFSKLTRIYGPNAGGYGLRGVDINGEHEAIIVGDYQTVMSYSVTTGMLTKISYYKEVMNWKPMIDAVWKTIRAVDTEDEDNIFQHSNIHPVMSGAGCWDMFANGLMSQVPYWQPSNICIIIGMTAAGAVIGFLVGGPVGALVGGDIGAFAGIAYVMVQLSTDDYRWGPFNSLVRTGLSDVVWIDNQTADITGYGGYFRYDQDKYVGSTKYEVNDDFWGFKDKVIDKKSLWDGPGLIDAHVWAPLSADSLTTFIYKDTTGSETNYMVFGKDGGFAYQAGDSWVEQTSFSGGITGRDCADSNDPLGTDQNFHESLTGKFLVMTGLDRRATDGKTFGTFLSFGVDHVQVGDVVRFDGDSLRLVNTGAGTGVSDFKWYPDGSAGLACAGEKLIKYTEEEYLATGLWDSMVYTIPNPYATIGQVRVTWNETNTTGRTWVQGYYRVMDGESYWKPLANGVISSVATDYGVQMQLSKFQMFQCRFVLAGDTLLTPFVDDVSIEYWYWAAPDIAMNDPENLNASSLRNGPDLWTLDPIGFEGGIGALTAGYETDPIESMFIEWNFGDDSTPATQPNDVNSTSLKQTHEFQYGGTYLVNVSAALLNYPLMRNSVARSVHIRNRPPVAELMVHGATGYSLNFTEYVRPGGSLELDGSRSYDLDGDQTIHSYTWYDGISSVSNNLINTYNMTFTLVGTYNVSLTVRDGGERNYENTEIGVDHGDVIVMEGNLPPIPRATQAAYTTQFGKPVTLNANPSGDAAGDTGIYEDKIVAASWEVVYPGNNTVIWRQNLSYPTPGFMQYTFTPNMTFAGKTYDIYLTVLDDDDASDDGISMPKWSRRERVATLQVTYFPATGDWEVLATDGFVHVKDADASMHGNIILRSGAHVDLSNTRLKMVSQVQNDVYIQVDSGARLELNNNTFIQGDYNEPSPGTGGRQSFKYYLFYSHGLLTIDNSTVQNVGYQEVVNWFLQTGPKNGVTAMSNSRLYINDSVIEHNQLTGVCVNTNNPVIIKGTEVNYCDDEFGITVAGSGTGVGIYGNQDSHVTLSGCSLQYNQRGVLSYSRAVLYSSSITGKGTGVQVDQGYALIRDTYIATQVSISLRQCDYDVHDTRMIGKGGMESDPSYSVGFWTYMSIGDFNNNTLTNHYQGFRIDDGSTAMIAKGTTFERNTYGTKILTGSNIVVKNYIRAYVTLDGVARKGVLVQLADNGIQVGANLTSDTTGYTGWLLVKDRTIYSDERTDQTENTFNAYDTYVVVQNMAYDAGESKTIEIALTSTPVIEKDQGFLSILGLNSGFWDWLPDSLFGKLLVLLVFLAGVAGVALEYQYLEGKFIWETILGTVLLEGVILTGYASLWIWFGTFLFGAVVLGWYVLWQLDVVDSPIQYYHAITG